MTENKIDKLMTKIDEYIYEGVISSLKNYTKEIVNVKNSEEAENIYDAIADNTLHYCYAEIKALLEDTE